jgi:hypothetical protein
MIDFLLSDVSRVRAGQHPEGENEKGEGEAAPVVATAKLLAGHDTLAISIPRRVSMRICLGSAATIKKP